jgi:pectate lyase
MSFKQWPDEIAATNRPVKPSEGSVMNRMQAHKQEPLNRQSINWRRNGRSATLIGVLMAFALAANGHTGAIGFGSKATGGAGGKEVTVSTIEDLIKYAASEGPVVITVKGKLVHNVSGGADDSRIVISSNKTIQGADENAAIDANLTNARENEKCSNIIIRNIHLSNPEGKGTGDAVEFTNGVSNIWVDHVTFGQSKDGSLDFKRGADLATVSWCKFDYPDANAGHNYVNLVGHSDQYPDLDRGKLRVTFHHNWYSGHSHQRMPRVRYGQVHVFNTYYAPNLRPPEKTKTDPDYIIGVGVEAQVLLEASYFVNPNGHKWTGKTSWYNWYPVNKCLQPCAEGRIQWTDDNIFTAGTSPGDWTKSTPVFVPPYPYNLDDARDVPRIVQAGAGNRGKTAAASLRKFSHVNAFVSNANYEKAQSRLKFHLGDDTDLRIDIYNVAGGRVATVYQGRLSAGSHNVPLDLSILPIGVRHVKFTNRTTREVVRMTVNGL